jgi:RecA-family ATPase
VGEKREKEKKIVRSSWINDKKEYSAFDLYKNDIETVPKLLDPFLQTVGLASLVGTSDSGKSTILRQLALSIALGLDEFLGFKLNTKEKKVIYVSTEDDPISISPSIKKQINYYKSINSVKEEDALKNLTFLFDNEDIIDTLNKKLSVQNVDLIVIDAFTDVFNKEINANTQVRSFLNRYDNLAKKYRCLIVFLHHIGKRRDKINPSKDSIIGTQAFEAKMRVVLELRPRGANDNEVDLWVLKSNFLQQSHKRKSYVLEFKDGAVFENTNNRSGMSPDSKLNDTSIIREVLQLQNEGKSVREIAEELKKSSHNISKSTVHTIIKEHKTQE